MVDKELLKEVLLAQRQRAEQAQAEDFVLREKLGQISGLVPIRQSIVVTGIRRCGKSVFLSQIVRRYFDENYYFVNFEDERLADFGLKDFERLYEACIGLFGKAKTFFLDEIQGIAGWERWVRRMYDDGFKFFITGSNATLLSKELATLLTGRHVQVSLYPFSFREFLDFHKFELKPKDIYLTERRAVIKKLFAEYIENGGFPEYLKHKRIEILQEYFNDIVQRDIVGRYGIKNIRQLKELAKYLITNTGNLTTYRQLKKMLEMKSVNTVIKYLSYLENAFLVFAVPYFSYSLKRQAANPFKTFAADTGLRNAISFKFSRDLGRLYETVVAIELKRKGKEFYYWKTSHREEVDFVIKEEKIKQLIQVCHEIDEPAVKKRELKSLLEASKELKCRNLLVITDDYEAEERIEGRLVKFAPLWKWLLA
jgi:hypothetical protein